MHRRTIYGGIGIAILVCVVIAISLLLNRMESIEMPEPSLEKAKDSLTPIPEEISGEQIIETSDIDKEQFASDTLYRSEKCLYMSPLSSIVEPTDGYDSKAYYHVTDIGFERMERAENGEVGIRWDYYLPEGGPVWKEFPFTIEAWNDLFIGLEQSDLLSGYEQIEYMELREGDAFLLKPDNELWMVIMNKTPEGISVWCIYTLVPVTEEPTSIKKYYLLPQELKEITTQELLDLSSQSIINALLYEQMTLYLEMLCRRYNGAEELVKREDLAKVVLEEFQKDTFMIKKDLSQSQWEEQKAYDAKCFDMESKIALEEVLLATNVAFDQMDEEMRQATLKEAYEKVELRLSGRFARTDSVGTYPSGFFGYIRCTKDSGSKWYDYLVEQGEEEVLNLMEDDWIHKFMP